MAFLHFDNVGIAALAGALPEHVQKIDMDPANPRAAYIAQFVKQTGVRQRHISITEQTATDMGYRHAQGAGESPMESGQSGRAHLPDPDARLQHGHGQRLCAA